MNFNVCCNLQATTENRMCKQKGNRRIWNNKNTKKARKKMKIDQVIKR